MVKAPRTFSATSIQIISNQFLGLVFFLLLALYLEKDSFGELNWATAVSYTTTVIFTFGFDHVVIRRIAAGGNHHTIAGTYMAHCLLVAGAGFLLMAAHRLLFPGFHEVHHLLWLVFIGSLFSFAASPLKQLANGREHFWDLAVMNVSANFFRVAGTVYLLLAGALNALTLGWLFLAAGVAELITAMVVSWLDERSVLLPVFRLKVYGLMVREALPSLGAVMLESAFARLDWILLGLMSTGVALADYSFAYKAFDSSRIPLLIIAPVLLPAMARLHGSRKKDPAAILRLNRLWQAEAFVSVLIPLVLGVCWIDLVDILTRERYGASAFPEYMILAMGMPLLYITNFLWTNAFTQKKYRITVLNSAAVLASNLILNLILIPAFGAVGAAWACTGSLFVQTVLYILVTKRPAFNPDYLAYIKSVLTAASVGFLLYGLPLHWAVKGVLALVLYGLLSYFTGALRFLRAEAKTFPDA